MIFAHSRNPIETPVKTGGKDKQNIDTCNTFEIFSKKNIRLSIYFPIYQ
jgi:hypothetical protein